MFSNFKEWCGKWVPRCWAGKRNAPLAQLETSRRLFLFISSTARRTEPRTRCDTGVDGTIIYNIYSDIYDSQESLRSTFHEKYVSYWSEAIQSNIGDSSALWSKINTLLKIPQASTTSSHSADDFAIHFRSKVDTYNPGVNFRWILCCDR